MGLRRWTRRKNLALIKVGSGIGAGLIINQQI
jgi:predicted NBD/HSP70 family sugar kinase